MPAPSDLVHETSTTTGTGNFTLTNANGKRSFNTAFGTGGTDIFDYYISNRDAAEWERGTGHLSAASTLVRDTVIASSNSNNAVNFSAGTKDVTNDVPATSQHWGTGVTPGGRLTVASATPVITATDSGNTTMYYTPYLHDKLPLFDGKNWRIHQFTELSQATTDNTKSPAAVAADSNYDIFGWDDSATLRATRGAAWSSSTARGTGAGTTELEYLNGILVNKIAITNGPAAQRGTYLGTIRSNGSSQIDYILGGTAAGGTAAVIGVWNMYNRVTVSPVVKDSTNAYTYNSTTIRSLNNSAGNRISMIRGLDEDGVTATLQVPFTGGASGDYAAAVSLDATASLAGGTWGYGSFGASTAPLTNIYAGLPGLGWHFLQNVEKQFTTASAATIFTKFAANAEQGHQYSGVLQA